MEERSEESRPADVSVLINEPKVNNIQSDTLGVHTILQSDRGLWQLFHWFVFVLTAACCCWQTFSPAFLVPLSDCSSVSSDLRNSSSSGDKANESSSLIVWPTLKMGSCFDHLKASNCSERDYIRVGSDQIITKCSPQDRSDFSDVSNVTVALYGTPSHLATTKSIYMIGSFFAITLLLPVLNRFGQRCAIFSGFLLFYLCSVAACFTSSLSIFIGLRFFISLGITSVFWITLRAMLESVVPDYRLIYGAIGHLGWAIGYMFLPVISWCTTDWFSYLASTSIPCLLLAVPLCFLPESLNYLLRRGKIREAIEIVKAALMKDNKSLDDVSEICHQSHRNLIKMSRDAKENLCLRLKAHLGYRNLLFYASSFWISLLYYVLSWNFYTLPGDPFTNFAWAGAMETLAVLLLMFFGYFVGQRLLLLLTALGASVFPVAGMLTATGEVWIPFHPYMAAKFFVTGAVILTMIRSFEESKLFATGAVVSIGAVLAPFLEKMVVGDYINILMLVSCCLCLILGILSALFPPRHAKFTV